MATPAPDWLAAALEHVDPTERRKRFSTPGQLARFIFPKTVQTPALDLIDAFLVELADSPDGRGIVTMPPQEGKSTRVALDFPVWRLIYAPDTRIVVASYSASLATRNGKSIRRVIQHNPELGLRLEPGSESASDWTLLGYSGGVFSIGILGGLTGRPAELLVIDDPIKDRKEADSETYRENIWEWWREVANARLAPGAPVIVVLTRWHEDDLAGRLIAEADSEWRVLNIPAQADHDPNKAQTDVLDREPGEFMISARGRTTEQWERRKRTSGERAWQALYQGRPSPAEGGILKESWWQLYEQPMWFTRPDGAHLVNTVGQDAELIQSWDMTFKDTKGSDFVVGQVWLRVAANAYLLDQVRGRWSFTQTCSQLEALSAKWPQATAKLIEDTANGPAVMNALRARVGGMIPVTPEGSKYARASAVSPLVEGKNVWLFASAPYREEFVTEAKTFPNAVNDDQVDAFSQAIHRLLLVPILSGELITEEDYLDDIDLEYEDAGISPY